MLEYSTLMCSIGINQPFFFFFSFFFSSSGLLVVESFNWPEKLLAYDS